MTSVRIIYYWQESIARGISRLQLFNQNLIISPIEVLIPRKPVGNILTETHHIGVIFCNGSKKSFFSWSNERFLDSTGRNCGESADFSSIANPYTKRGDKVAAADALEQASESLREGWATHLISRFAVVGRPERTFRH